VTGPEAVPRREPTLGPAAAAAVQAAAVATVAALAAFGAGTVPWARAAFPLAAVALALLALFAALATRRGGAPAWSAGEAWLLALAAWAALQALSWPAPLARLLAPWSTVLREEGLGAQGGVRPSLDAGMTWGAALVLAGLAALSWTARTATRAAAGAWLQRALCLAAVAHAVVGLRHGRYGEDEALLGGHALRNSLNAYGTFPNQGQFAAFLLLATGSALVRWRAGGVLDRALALGTLGVVGAGVAASGSRAGALGFGLALAWAFVASARPGRRLRRTAVVGAVGLALVAARFAGVEALVRATTPKPGETRRLDIWRGSLGVAKEQPVVGVGADAFGDAYSDPSRPISDRGVETAEDQALEILAEGGVVGAALAAAGALSLVRAWRRRRRALDPEGRARLALAGATLVALLPAFVTSAPLHAPAFAAGAVLAWHAALSAAGPSGYPRAPDSKGAETA
jgi:O-antigen ligase